jgi:hypothetical protein
MKENTSFIVKILGIFIPLILIWAIIGYAKYGDNLSNYTIDMKAMVEYATTNFTDTLTSATQEFSDNMSNVSSNLTNSIGDFVYAMGNITNLSSLFYAIGQMFVVAGNYFVAMFQIMGYGFYGILRIIAGAIQFIFECIKFLVNPILIEHKKSLN